MWTKFKEAHTLRAVQVALVKRGRRRPESCGEMEAHGERTSEATGKEITRQENSETQTEVKTLDFHIPQNTPWPVAEPGTWGNMKDGGEADYLGTG